jgi:hypothetical protein
MEHMQQELKWRYYNHAIIPTTAPHETADISALEQKDIWKAFGGHPILARWTSDFDCDENTCWWYCIKNKPFDFADVKSNYRQKIRKGLGNFDVRVIEPMQYADALYKVLEEAIESYPVKCRIKVEREAFIADLKDWNNGITFAAFSREDNSLAGHMFVRVQDGYATLSVLKARPSEEKNQVNAAIVYAVLEHFQKDFSGDFYILAGERTINHDTNIHEYLDKYFGFRNAYCRMHIKYRPPVKFFVDCLYPLRGLIRRLKIIKVFCLIYGVLRMEEIARNCKDGVCMLPECRHTPKGGADAPDED